MMEIYEDPPDPLVALSIYADPDSPSSRVHVEAEACLLNSHVCALEYAVNELTTLTRARGTCPRVRCPNSNKRGTSSTPARTQTSEIQNRRRSGFCQDARGAGHALASRDGGTAVARGARGRGRAPRGGEDPRAFLRLDRGLVVVSAEETADDGASEQAGSGQRRVVFGEKHHRETRVLGTRARRGAVRAGGARPEWRALPERRRAAAQSGERQVRDARRAASRRRDAPAKGNSLEVFFSLFFLLFFFLLLRERERRWSDAFPNGRGSQRVPPSVFLRDFAPRSMVFE